ncbi:MAG: NAD(P)(+) transhydrogenase (Re/Si-specific) subunit beta [Bacilli bacterium]|nr:NAD(P)(+) transhydrogenase (Re/Si-specific) subunit beta [Bacilli bacterium]
MFLFLDVVVAPAFDAWIYYVISGLLAFLVLLGIFLMSNVKKAVLGNRLSALAMVLAILVTLIYNQILPYWYIYIAMAIGTMIGILFTIKVKMIQMPELVALLNGLGGASSAFVGIFALMGIGTTKGVFSNLTSAIAIVIGFITLIGSLIAAGKLHRILPQKPIVYKNHKFYTLITLLFTFVLIVVAIFSTPIIAISHYYLWLILAISITSLLFGYFFSIRVGGADMPITISLLNSFSGVAAAIAGLAISDVLLVSIGGIVGASGLLLTQIMCKAMNRKLFDILLSKTTQKKSVIITQKVEMLAVPKKETSIETSVVDVIKQAKSVIIVPGYGMAVAQAQHLVKKLADFMRSNGTTIKYAIHPVAGRMPGHMNVLLCEANVDYEDLYEMDDINNEFKSTDLTIVIGANDVMNPAARNAVGTPIYGMPILDVDDCKQVIIFNYDLKPGYAGVENPIYQRTKNIYLELGNASDTIAKILSEINNPTSPEEKVQIQTSVVDVIKQAKSVIIVPGYGMAVAQAQHLVKKLADFMRSNGTTIKYAIHPVAGRMPGHMNVLLCEANVDYEDLYEMDDINNEFKSTDLTIVIGANDVMNPAARNAVGTPIYGMPILDVDDCKQVIIFNYDLKPGYAGVENPIYQRTKNIYLELGNASDTIAKVLEKL